MYFTVIIIFILSFEIHSRTFICLLALILPIINNSPMKGLSSIANKFGMSTPSSAVEGFESAEML